jgi:hypothetical protein
MTDGTHGYDVDVWGTKYLVIVRKDDSGYLAFGDYKGQTVSASGKSREEALQQWRDSAERRGR